jgi:hypothetical protein
MTKNAFRRGEGRAWVGDQPIANASEPLAMPLRRVGTTVMLSALRAECPVLPPLLPMC